MATNDFIPFATGGGANVESQSAYLVDPQVPIGQQPGVARSALNNKALRQATSIAAALAQYLANSTGNNVLDDGNQSELLTTLGEAFANAMTAVTSFFWTGYFTQTASWSTSSVSYADPTLAGTATLTTRQSNGITVTAAASSVPGITFTPASATAEYQITATYNLNGNTASAYVDSQLVGNGTVLIQAPSVQQPSTLPQKFSAVTLSSVFVPGNTSPATVKLQLAVNAGSAEISGGELANPIEWSIMRMA
jgi:hypothetical protein